MTETTVHPYPPKDSFNGGDLDCGNGLLLLIRKHIDPLAPGELLEIVSRDSTVEVDLPSWCNLTKNELINVHTEPGLWRFLVSKGPFTPPADAPAPITAVATTNVDPDIVIQPQKLKKKRKKPQMAITQEVVDPFLPQSLPEPVDAAPILPLSVLSLGSWPRPRWLLSSLHQHLEGRLSTADFEADADDAVQLAVAAQERAGIDVVTDGEQRRDNYASFVGGILQNCQLIPVTDLLPYVDDPEQFNEELQALDVPAREVRHPAVFGPLGRRDPLTVPEVEFAQSVAQKPVKVSLPGPYLLTRTMWMECISDRAYDDREALAVDIVRILREEVAHLLAQGTSIVQFDEPVLTEVLYGEQGQGGRTFMCGALGERGAQDEALAFAQHLLEQVTQGFPTDRLALHVCRGNWTTDESSALSGGYAPLVPLFRSINVGTLILELCTPRAAELDALTGIREDQRVGVGVLNQKDSATDTVDDVIARAEEAIELFGYDRVLLNTDCGFATFADNPIQSARAAERDLSLLVQARDQLRTRYGAAA